MMIMPALPSLVVYENQKEARMMALPHPKSTSLRRSPLMSDMIIAPIEEVNVTKLMSLTR